MKGKIDIRSIVLELPPAPADLVLVGRAFATLSALSAAAFLLIAVFGPPGGDRFRPVLTPADAGGETGEAGPGEDWELLVVKSRSTESTQSFADAEGKMIKFGVMAMDS